MMVGDRNSQAARLVLAWAGAMMLAAGAARAADWPSWRGPDRTDISAEDSGWKAGGWPPAAAAWWKDVGAGENSPVVGGGRVFVLGRAGGADNVYCLDPATGNEVWKQTYPSRGRSRFATGDEGAYIEGTISTPSYDAQTGYLFSLGVDGELNCWNTAQKGAKVWGFNLFDTFRVGRRSGNRDYGYTSSPLVYGDWVVAEVGSGQGNLVAFDKKTGKRAWASEDTSMAGHTGGPVPIVVDKVPCIAALCLGELLVVRTDPGKEGRTVAKYPYRPQYNAYLTTPAWWDGLMVVSNHLGSDDLVQISLGSAVRRGNSPHVEVSSPIFCKNRLYKIAGRLECWDVKATGITKVWAGDDFGTGGTLILTADDKLICLGNGRLALYDADGKKLAEKSGVATGWPHVAFAGGRVYCKNSGGRLECYVVNPSPTPAPPETALRPTVP